MYIMYYVFKNQASSLIELKLFITSQISLAISCFFVLLQTLQFASLFLSGEVHAVGVSVRALLLYPQVFR